MAKLRVHELAKELGVDSKTVLAKLSELGEFVKTASSTVEAPVAKRVRDAFPKKDEAKKDAPAAKPKAAPKPTAGAKPGPAKKSEPADEA